MTRSRLTLFIAFISAVVIVVAGVFDVSAVELPREAPIEQVGRQYYEQVKLAKECRERDSQRDSKAKKADAPTSLDHATGVVVDRRGRPVVDAQVVIQLESSDKDIGRGKTDAQGKFNVKLSPETYRGLSIEVTKAGFDRSAFGGIYGGIVDRRIQLDQPLDDAFYKRFGIELNPVERYWMLLEIVGRRFSGAEITQMFPHIGEVRPELLVIIQSKLFDKPDDRAMDIPAEEARKLLYYWHDPADEAVFAKANWPGIRKTSHVGDTPEEACEEYVESHFGDTPPQQRTYNHLNKPIVSPDGDHAVVEFSVMYKHWGYDELLFLTRQDGEWKVNLAMEHRRICHIQHGE